MLNTPKVKATYVTDVHERAEEELEDFLKQNPGVIQLVEELAPEYGSTVEVMRQIRMEYKLGFVAATKLMKRLSRIIKPPRRIGMTKSHQKSGLSDDQKTFIRGKVKELGSKEAVEAFYDNKDMVSEFAQECAALQYKTPKMVKKKRRTIDLDEDDE